MQTSSPAFGVIAESPCIGVIKCEPPDAAEADPNPIEWATSNEIEWATSNEILWTS